MPLWHAPQINCMLNSSIHALMEKTMSRSLLVPLLVFAATFSAHSQGPGGGRGGAGGPPPTPRAAAPFDMTGYWVSVVNEDWRWRMFQNKGDYAGIQMNAKGRKVDGAWDLAKVRAYGEQ